MAYSKTTWQNNVTDIDENNLNKIEQGIYDNSLVVDAVTDKLNPTDTETYKTAELTEGQITDVIGVNDIIIKGDTSQDGTPTPSAPVDVNVVSGSNVINTSNKNLCDTSKAQIGKAWNNAANIARAIVIIPVLPNTTYTLSYNNISGLEGLYYFGRQNENDNTASMGNNSVYSNPMQTTTTANTHFLGLQFNKTNISQTDIDNCLIQIELNSTATTYEPHQGKELPLDLPVENLLNISNDINTTTSGITVSLINTDIIDFNGVASNTYISTGTVNLTKPLESGKTYCFKAFGNNDSNLRFRIWGYNSNNELKFNVADGNSLTLNTDIIKYKLVLEWLTANNKYNVQAKFQVSEAPYINTYTPYGTEPIELCKIGNYQDYFYKSGSKWYLHKEIEKIVLDENASLGEQSQSSFYRYSYADNKIKNDTSLVNSLILFSNYFKPITFNNRNNQTNETVYAICNGISRQNAIMFNTTTFTSLSDFKTWLATNNVSVYYPLETSTDTEITNTNLISQLEAIYNAPLYEQTNITQENNDLPMVLDITACKDNINGIKAFIRK